MPDLVPLELLALTPLLDGSNGRNRATGRTQIGATDDRAAALAWLARYADSPATLAAYRKEVERLLLWCALQHRKAMSDLTHEDLLVFQHFLGDPQPAATWVMAPGQKPGRSSPAWRPFAGRLSESSRRQAMLILNGFFNWLVEAGYLAGNPLALAKRRCAKRKPRVTRFLPHEHWGAVKDAICAMDASTPALEAMAARSRWIFSLLYLGGLRTSEICDGSMGDFLWRRSPDGTVRWWLEVTGKGQQTRLVPATTELMDEVKRYRLSLCLKPLPGEHEAFPLVAPLRGDKRLHISRSSLHAIVKDVMRAAAAVVRQKGPEFEEVARHIEQASTHWMRHTAASHQTDKADVKYVRDNLGHASITTTNIYTHTEDDMRHDVMSATHKIGW